MEGISQHREAFTTLVQSMVRVFKLEFLGIKVLFFCWVNEAPGPWISFEVLFLLSLIQRPYFGLFRIMFKGFGKQIQWSLLKNLKRMKT